MYSLEVLITVALGMAVVGIVAGVFIAQRTAPSRKTQHQLEEHLTELQQQQQEYQHEVTEHFEETAQLLNQLTTNYKDIHNHLARGAQLLAGDQVDTTIKALTEEGQQETPTPVALEEVAPPLDYAPKNQDEPGMLNEEFGLEKKANENDEPEIAANR